MKKAIIFNILWMIIIPLLVTSAIAVEVAPRISDREIIEKLAKLEEGQKSIDKRFDDVNKRFDDLKTSTQQQINDLKESTNKRFDTLQWMFGVFITVALSLMVIVVRILWTQRKQLTEIETSLETQKDELLFFKTLIEKLLPPRGVL